MFKKKTLHLALICAALVSSTFAWLPSARADDDVIAAPPSLSYLSVKTNISEYQQSAAADSPALAPKSKGGMFTDSQADLMRTLSKTIDVIPGGVALCLNLKY